MWFNREEMQTEGKEGAQQVELRGVMSVRGNVQYWSVTCDKEC